MTNTRKTTTTAEPETAPTPQAEPTTTTEAVLGPPLRAGQTPEKVTFAHHLRIGRNDFRPGDTAVVSPDYARQLRGNGYLARGRS
ncbi:hypothetical protein [Streptomyces tirandamycinicus]|uniref:Uncharacterized protein n=1 Tax=Streptomyces tirandamycinicus TaxID=2174846 RepID=A0A2S1T1Z2_9ACTN|nr:hypothetical protein [Streptomyces tirandamycinicus]AWI32693.1 hypothetical protein DDW44_30725 [Streptomyces tirandamycinicus]